MNFNLCYQTLILKNKNMKIENEKVKVSFGVGTSLNGAVLKSIDFCIDYKTEVELTFNATKHTITRFTNQEKIVDNWYK